MWKKIIAIERCPLAFKIESTTANKKNIKISPVKGFRWIGIKPFEIPFALFAFFHISLFKFTKTMQKYTS